MRGKKNLNTQDIIHVSREVWDRMRWCTKRIIYPNVKIIENDKEEVIEDGK